MSGNGESRSGNWKHRTDQSGERAVWTEAQRRTYRAEHHIVPPITEPRALALHYFYRLPRPLLVLLALLACAYMLRAESEWRTSIVSHVTKGENAMFRLSDVERLAINTADQVRLLREEQMRARVDQLDFYKWMATDRGDSERAKTLTQELIVAKSRIITATETEPQAAAPN